MPSGQPDVKSLLLDGTEDFVIIACDGLWDVIPPWEVIVATYLSSILWRTVFAYFEYFPTLRVYYVAIEPSPTQQLLRPHSDRFQGHNITRVNCHNV